MSFETIQKKEYYCTKCHNWFFANHKEFFAGQNLFGNDERIKLCGCKVKNYVEGEF